MTRLSAAAGLLALAAGCGWPSRVIGLRPIEPAPHAYRSKDASPMFRWEAFPTPEFPGPVAGVRYELRVVEQRPDGGVREVYARRGLERPEHRLEVSLVPGGTYFWSVRAWFRREGRVRVTPWSHFGPDASARDSPGRWLPIFVRATP